MTRRTEKLGSVSSKHLHCISDEPFTKNGEHRPLLSNWPWSRSRLFYLCTQIHRDFCGSAGIVRMSRTGNRRDPGPRISNRSPPCSNDRGLLRTFRNHIGLGKEVTNEILFTVHTFAGLKGKKKSEKKHPPFYIEKTPSTLISRNESRKRGIE